MVDEESGDSAPKQKSRVEVRTRRKVRASPLLSWCRSGPLVFLQFSPDAAPMYGLQLGADVNAAPHGCVLVHLYASARSIEQAAENVKRLRALAHALTTPLDEAAAAAAALDARSSSASRACSRWEATNSGWLAATLLLALLHPVLPRHFCSRLVPPPASPSGWTTVSSRRNACSACCILP